MRDDPDRFDDFTRACIKGWLFFVICLVGGLLYMGWC